MKVCVPASSLYRTPETHVVLSPVNDSRVLWEVTWKGKSIGFVWKGTRLYSPPTHRGSRVVRYHKQIPEWKGSRTSTYAEEYWADTRRSILTQLVLAAFQAEE